MGKALLHLPHVQFLLSLLGALACGLLCLLRGWAVFWGLLSCYLIYKARGRARAIQRRSCARTWPETLLAVSGLFNDLSHCRTRLYRRKSRGWELCNRDAFVSTAGERMGFEVVRRNGYGAPRAIMQEEGWTLAVHGPLPGEGKVPVDVLQEGEGLIGTKGATERYLCTVRKAGRYRVAVRFRGCHIKGSPFSLRVNASSIDASESFLACSDQNLFPVPPLSPNLLQIQTFDKFGNQRKRGGTIQGLKLELRHNDSEWWEHPVEKVDDHHNGSYDVHFLNPERSGLYQSRLIHGGQPIGKEVTEFSVLSEAGIKQVHKFLKKNIATFKVALDEYPKINSAWLRITQSQISVGHYKLHIKWKHLYTMKVNHNVKMRAEGKESSVVSFSNPAYLQEIKCRSSERELISASLLAFIRARSGCGVMTHGFEERRLTFCRMVMEERRKSRSSHSEQVIKVRRDDLVSSAYKKLKGMTSKGWRSKWRVVFAGEHGIDVGGLRRELLTLLAREIFQGSENTAKEWRLFERLSSGAVQPKVEKDRNSAVIIGESGQRGSAHNVIEDTHNVSEPSLTTKELTARYTFAGKLLAKSVYDTVVFDPSHVNVRLSSGFCKQLLNLPVHYADFERDDPEFYSSKVKYILQNKVTEDLGLFFAEEEYSRQDGRFLLIERELKPNGATIPVTEENKYEYLLLLAKHRLVGSTAGAVKAFAKGFFSIVPRQLVDMFDEKELELLVCGLPTIEVEDMRYHTVLERLKPSDQEVQWFWAAVELFTESERARLLQFITGSSQVPVEGFAAFFPALTVARSASAKGSLPTAHTCFNKLDLPAYDSYHDLQTKLLLAITEGSEGFAFG